MIKKLLVVLAFLAINVVMFYGGYLLAQNTLTTDSTVEVRAELSEPKLFKPEPIDVDALQRERAIHWMTQARDAHQDLVNSPKRREYWFLTLEGEIEWVRRYEIVVEFLESQR